MKHARHNYVAQVLERFGLEALSQPVHLEVLAKKWGVTSVEKRPIDSDAMLIANGGEYTVILRDVRRESDLSRQRFSFAHELGHLLLHKVGYPNPSSAEPKHRSHYNSNSVEERLCDQIASEILMPSLAFTEDAWMAGWSIRNLRALARKYGTSIPATAIRMIDLMPEVALLGVWRLSDTQPSLVWSHTNEMKYGVPSASVVPLQRMALVVEAWETSCVHSGVSPLVDKQANGGRPNDVPAEAQSWGQGEYKQVMVFYYPEREPSMGRPSGSPKRKSE